MSNQCKFLNRPLQRLPHRYNLLACIFTIYRYLNNPLRNQTFYGAAEEGKGLVHVLASETLLCHTMQIHSGNHSTGIRAKL